jgi:hypothetical protein
LVAFRHTLIQREWRGEERSEKYRLFRFGNGKSKRSQFLIVVFECDGREALFDGQGNGALVSVVETWIIEAANVLDEELRKVVDVAHEESGLGVVDD